MYITEEKLVEAYGKATPHERFRLIYKNYSIFPQLVDCYETGLFNRILFEVEYKRRKKNDDDLGVRIQTSHRSDPTAAKAIEYIMIRDAIEECNFSGNILKETDDPEKHKRDILTIHMMRREYEVFDTSLKALPLAEFKITYIGAFRTISVPIEKTEVVHHEEEGHWETVVVKEGYWE